MAEGNIFPQETDAPASATLPVPPMPGDSGLAIGALAAWQAGALASGDDRISGLGEAELRACIKETGQLRLDSDPAKEAGRNGPKGERRSGLPSYYGAWQRRRIFQSLLHDEWDRWRLPAVQYILFDPSRYFRAPPVTTQRREWTVRVFAAEAMLLAALESEFDATGIDHERRHSDDCAVERGAGDIAPPRDHVEAALEEMGAIEAGTQKVRDLVVASLRASPRQGVELRREIASVDAGSPPRSWWVRDEPVVEIGSAVMLLAGVLATGAWSGLLRCRGGPLRILEVKAATALLCARAARALLESALNPVSTGGSVAARYCGCSVLSPARF